MTEYPGLVPSPPERTPQEWADWWEAFKRRNGLTRPLPHPPEDAPKPDAHWQEEAEERND